MISSVTYRHELGLLALLWLAWVLPAGLLADESPPELGTIVWHLPLDERASTVALGDDGQVYTTVGDRLLALSAEGQVLWEHRSGGWPFQSAPMITDDGLVLVATERSWWQEGSYQVQALSPEGEVIWELADFANARVPAMMPGGDILLFSGPFGEAPQAHRMGPGGEQIWQQAISSQGGFGSPSVRGDGVSFLPGGLCVGPDGSILWSVYHGAACSTAAIGRDGTTYYSASTDTFIARATDGSIRWEYPAGSVASSPALLLDDSVVFGAASGKMVRLDRDGGLVWEQEVGAPVTSSPAITADGVIWCGTGDGRFFALHGDDGTVRWEWFLGSSVDTSPAVGPDGRVYIAATDGGVYAIQGAAGPAESAWPMYRHDAARRARNEVVLEVPAVPTGVAAGEGFERGAVTVSWPTVSGAEHYELWRGGTPEEGEMSVLAERVTGETRFVDRTCEFEKPYYYRVRAGNGAGHSSVSEAVEGTQSTRRWIRAFESLPFMPPALGDDGLLRVILQASRLVAVDAAGEIRWEVEVGPVVSGPVLGRDGTAYLVTFDDLVAIDDRGGMRWSSALPPLAGFLDYSPNGIALTGDGELVVAVHPGCLYWYSPEGTLVRTASTVVYGEPFVVVTEDGGVCVAGKARRELPTPYNLSMFERNGYLRWHRFSENKRSMAGGPDGSIIAVGNGQLISKAASGTLDWSWGFGPENAQAFIPVVGMDGTIYLPEPHRLSVLNKDGLRLWTETVLQLSSSPALLEDGTMLFYRGNRLVARGEDGALLWEVFLPNVNPFVGNTSPIVAPDGTIYVVGGTNLLCLVGSSPLADGVWPCSRRDVRQSGSLAMPSPPPAELINASASQGTSVHQIRLSWAPNPDIAWVEVWRSPGSDLSSAVQIGVVGPGVFGFYDAGFHPGEICHYWLRARNDAGTNDFTQALRGYASADARQVWVYEAGADLSVPAFGLGDLMLVTTADGTLLAIDDQGAVAWSFVELAPPLHGPAVALDGTVFVHNGNELAAVRADGSLRWKRSLPGGGAAPMTVGWDGSLYLGQQDRLTAFDPDGAQRWQKTSSAGRLMHTVMGADGLLRCKDYSVDVFQEDGAYVRSLSGGGPMALALDGSIFFGDIIRVLKAVDSGGAILYSFGSVGGGRTLPEDGPVIGQGGVAFVSRTVSWQSDWTYAVSGQGQALWEFPAVSSGMVAEDSGGVILARTNHVTALHADGALRWDYYREGVLPSAPLLTDEGVLCFSTGRRLIALETALRPAAGGWPMWRADAQRSGRTSASSRILECLWTEDGEWEVCFAGVAGKCYVIEQSSDLIEWSVAAECVAVPGTTHVTVAFNDGQGRCFFRIRQE